MPETTPREVIMRALTTTRSDIVLEGYAGMCRGIERALTDAGFVIVPREATPHMAGDDNERVEPYWRGVRRSLWAEMVKLYGKGLL